MSIYIHSFIHSFFVSGNVVDIVLNNVVSDVELQMNKLIAELNDILAETAGPCTVEDASWQSKLTPESRALFQSLPAGIAAQLLLDRDPHGNVQVVLKYLVHWYICTLQIWYIDTFGIL